MSITTEAKTSSGVTSSFCINRAHRGMTIFQSNSRFRIGIGSRRGWNCEGDTISRLISRGPSSGTWSNWEASKLAGDSPRGAFPYWFTMLDIWLSMDVKEGTRLYEKKKWNLFLMQLWFYVFFVFFNYNCYQWVFLRNGNPLLNTNLGLRRNTDASPPMWLSFIYMYFDISGPWK